MGGGGKRETDKLTLRLSGASNGSTPVRKHCFLSLFSQVITRCQGTHEATLSSSGERQQSTSLPRRHHEAMGRRGRQEPTSLADGISLLKSPGDTHKSTEKTQDTVSTFYLRAGIYVCQGKKLMGL